MELTQAEIRKISKTFKIPEEEIKQFLQEEERLLKISSLKEAFLQKVTMADQALILKDWEANCQTFIDFEELYIIVSQNLLNENFFLNWMNSTKNYNERRTVYLCVVDNKSLTKKIIRLWIEKAKIVEDVREAISYVDKDSPEYTIGIKKIFKIYKS